jgi:hypothetical protein
VYLSYRRSHLILQKFSVGEFLGCLVSHPVSKNCRNFGEFFGLRECIIPGGFACACGSVDTEEAVPAAGGGGGEWRSVKICELSQLFCE